MGRRLASHETGRSAAILGLIGALIAIAPFDVAIAQELDSRVAQRCIRASALVVAYDDNGDEVGHGSGSVVDASGYVLTNFHVVGGVGTRGPVRPGELFNSHNTFGIGIATSARERVQVTYLAQVVRADVSLDLALLRIVATFSGEPLARGRRFDFVELGSSSRLQLGARVWAVGYPLDVETVNVTGGLLSGFEVNAGNDVAWIRTDAEFNPGNSGGMLVDARCRVVGVPTQVDPAGFEPIEFARPVDRIPPEWLRAMRRGIVGVEISGDEDVTHGSVISVVAIGDARLRDEWRYFRVSDEVRSGIVEAEGASPILGLVDADGVVLRSGVGRVAILPTDTLGLTLVAVVEDARRSPMRFDLVLRVPTTSARASRPTSTPAAPSCPPGSSIAVGRCRCDLATPTWNQREQRCVPSLATPSDAATTSGGGAPSVRSEPSSLVAAARDSYARADADTARILALSLNVQHSIDRDEIVARYFDAVGRAWSTEFLPYIVRMRQVTALGAEAYVIVARIAQAKARIRFLEASREALNALDLRPVAHEMFIRRFTEELVRRGIDGASRSRTLDRLMQQVDRDGTVDEAAEELRASIESGLEELVAWIYCDSLVDLLIAVRVARVAGIDSASTRYAVARLRASPAHSVEQCVNTHRVADPSVPPFVRGEF